jgi:hypothetical protein
MHFAKGEWTPKPERAAKQTKLDRKPIKLPRSKNSVANFLPTIGKIFAQTQHWPVVRPKVEIIDTKLYRQRLDGKRRRKEMRDRLNTRHPDYPKIKDPIHMSHLLLRDSLRAKLLAEAKINYNHRPVRSVSMKKMIEQLDKQGDKLSVKERRQLEDYIIAGVIEAIVKSNK